MEYLIKHPMVNYFKYISKKKNTCKIIKSIDIKFLFAHCFMGIVLLILQISVE